MLTSQSPERFAYLAWLFEIGDHQVITVDEAGRMVGERADLSIRLVLGDGFDQPGALLGDAPRRRDIVLVDNASIGIEIAQLHNHAHGCRLI